MKISLKSREIIPPLTLVFLLGLGWALSPAFFTVTNFTNILQYNAELALVALGLFFVIISGNGGIDLSVGSTLALSGILIAKFSLPLGVFGSIAVAVALGLLIGFVNGIVVTKGNVEAFIATFVVGSLARAVTFLITKGGPVLVQIDPSLQSLMQAQLAGIPLPAFYFVAAILIAAVVLRFTVLGRRLYGMGSNIEAVYLAGVPVRRLQVLLYMISGALAGLAGMLITARLGMGEPRAGVGMELSAIAALAVGGVSLYGGKGTALGALVGILIFAVTDNIMSIMNLSIYFQPISQGFIVIGAGLILSRRKNELST